MDDLISRQAAIRFIRDKVSLSLFMKRSVDKADKACMELCEMLDKDLPSAERLEVQSSGCEYWDDESNFCALNRPSAERRGRWIYNANFAEPPFKCSACGKSQGRLYKYCPDCGATMEVE